MQKSIVRTLLITGFILLVPFVLQLTIGSGMDGLGWNWTLSDFIIVGVVIFSVLLVYEVIAKRSPHTLYRVAFAIGLLGAFLLFWVNAAVGIIGSEDNPANLLYGAVFFVGLIGSLLSRFKPKGMSYTLFTAAIVQFLVPVFALFVWPAQTSWGAAGVLGVFVFNTIFAFIFLLSALLFKRSASTIPKPYK